MRAPLAPTADPASASASASASALHASPAASRAPRPSWRDPRLLLGVALLSVSVLAGARILESADDTVAVLAVESPVAAGQRIEPSELTTVRLRFADEADARRYLPSGTDLGGAVALRGLGAGELVPRDAVGGGRPALVELPLTLRPGRVPAAVRVGTSVDVWSAQPALDDEAAARHPEGELLLSGVPVIDAGGVAGADAGGLRHVVVGVPVADQPRLAGIVTLLSEESLLLVRRPG